MLGLFDLAFLSTKVSNLATSDYKSVVSVNLFVALLCACIIVGHLLEENRWINESITALAIVRFLFVVCTLHCVTRVKWLVFICVWQGLCTGVVILLTSKGKSSHLLVFSEDRSSGIVHPSTGYMVARTLALAPVLADTIAECLGSIKTALYV